MNFVEFKFGSKTEGFPGELIIEPCKNAPFDVSVELKLIKIVNRCDIPINLLCQPYSFPLSTEEQNADEYSHSHDKLKLCSSFDYLRTRFFTFTKCHLSYQCTCFVRVQGENHFAAVEYLGNNVWSLFRLPKHVSLKDIKSIPSYMKNDSLEIWKSFKYDEFFPTKIDKVQLNDGCLGFFLNSFGSSSTLYYDSWKPRLIEKQDLNSNVNELALKLNLTPPNAISNSGSRNLSELNTDSLASQNTTEVQLSTKKINKESVALKEYILTRYLDALYKSKTPLSYFAKTTLTRAKVSCKESQKHKFLIALENLILKDLSIFDFKYKTAIPFLNKKFYEKSIPDQTTDLSCISEQEIKYMTYWINEKSISTTTLLFDLKELKIRETQLQFILVLELLTFLRENNLHIVQKKDNEKENKLEKKRQSQKNTKSKDQKSEIQLTYESIADKILDRLCIWQALSSIEASLSQTQNNSNQASISSPNKNQDKLLHFFKEVIFPFYGNRIQKLVSKMYRKCDGKSSNKHSTKKLQKHNKSQDAIKEKGNNFSALQKNNSTISRSGSVCQTPPPGNLKRSFTPISREGTPFASFSSYNALNDDNNKAQNIDDANIVSFEDASASIVRAMRTNKLLASRQIDVPLAKKRISSNDNTTDSSEKKRRKSKGPSEKELQDAIKGITKPNRLIQANNLFEQREELKNIASQKQNSQLKSRAIRRSRQEKPSKTLVPATPEKSKNNRNIVMLPGDLNSLPLEQYEFITESARKPKFKLPIEHVPVNLNMKMNVDTDMDTLE